jgi:hypothetical protein
VGKVVVIKMCALFEIVTAVLLRIEVFWDVTLLLGERFIYRVRRSKKTD